MSMKKLSRKGNITLTSVIITILLFGVMITGIILFMGDLYGNYGVISTTDFSNTMQAVNRTMDIANDMSFQAKGSNLSTVETSETSWYDIGQKTVVGFVGAFKLAWNIPSIIVSIVADLNTNVGIPPAIIYVILAIIGVLIFAAIYYAITGRRA